MPRYVALLRGINVGGSKKVAMADLRALLSGLGYTNVRTHLQSGNAVLTSPSRDPQQLAGKIENRIKDRLGMSVRCLVRTRAEFRAVIDGNPLADVATNGSRMLALFLSEAPDPGRLAANDPRELAPEQIHLGDRVIYQWCPNGILEAPAVGAFVEKRLKLTATARNWNTVVKLAELLDE
jgi:uncharacterized protein (DUF1697 family)